MGDVRDDHHRTPVRPRCGSGARTGLWKRTRETCHYVRDGVPPVERAAAAIRRHWGIENRVHYVRDVTFAEDASRVRKNPGIFARVRSFATKAMTRMTLE